MAVTKILYLDIKDPNLIQHIYIPQYDSALRIIEIHLMDGETIYTIPSNVTITIQGTKPDSNIFVYPCSYNSLSGIVSVSCRTQMTVVAGDVKCQLVIVDSSGNRIGTFRFILSVEQAAVVEGTPQSDSEIAYAVQVLNDIQSRSLLKFINYSDETIQLSRVGNNT